MTTRPGFALSLDEKNPRVQNQAIRQLMEGRSNATGTVTLTHDGVATTTTVTAQNCGPYSIVKLTPQTAHAAAAVATTYVKATDVKAGQFTVTHAATSNSDVTFGWAALG